MPSFGRDVAITVWNNVRQKTFLSSGFRMKFDVRHRLASTKGTMGKVEIFNLTATTEDDLLKPSLRCTIEAGYKSGRGIIFDGYIMRAQRGREKVDRYMTLHLRSATLLEQTIMVAMGGVNTVGSVIRSVVNAIKADERFENVTLDNDSLSIIPKDLRLRDWSYTGPARLALDTLLQGVGKVTGLDGLTYTLDWTLQDGVIYIIAADADLGPYSELDPVSKPIDETVFMVSEATGLINVPEQLENGIRVRTLLNAGVRVDQLIEVMAAGDPRGREQRDPPFYEGKQWRTVEVRHNGDSFGGNDYFTEIEARGLI